MKERGLIFNGEMVRAILDCRKTQTRRIMKVQPENAELGLRRITDSSVAKEVGMYFWCLADVCGVKHRSNLFSCPFGAVGDRLWVRETFATGLCTKTTIAYRATHKPEDLEDGWWEPVKWTPSIHMPRWASRITLEITGVRVERLNSISQADAIAEGAPPSHPSIDAVSRDYGFPDFSRSWFGQTWAHIYGEESWQANSWVWVVEFKRIGGGAA
ncbi:hypothetical protein [Cronobacter sakazakii]|uniref:hypothetical protein n=1 Tax=Cronobacter sakazakii TaxID=28141 RepID=UPI00025F648D|nr:hypothetical protein [Cronobacter sakazakii]AFJ98818.1 hypothetical protein ES15_1245 [Cronobacter sakazakii ES15]HDK7277869.1 hypothetical protein [Cronobacter sakazakii]